MLQEVKHCRNLEAGPDTEAMEGSSYQLAAHDFLILLSYTTQNSLSKVGIVTMR